MSELTVLFFALLFKVIGLCVTVVAAAYLAFHGKEGWGWLMLLALILGSTSYKYTPDTKECPPQLQRETT